MNFLIGIRTDDYVIMASDKNVFAYGAMSVSEGFTFVLKPNFLKTELDFAEIEGCALAIYKNLKRIQPNSF